MGAFAFVRPFLALSAIACASQASAQTGGSLMSECANLLKPNLVALKSNKVAQLAVLKTAQSSSDEKGETNASASVMSYFSGTYGSKSEANRQLSTYDSLNWSQNEFRDYVAAYVPSEAYPAYNTCVNTVLSTPGIHLRIESADASSLVINLRFVGAVGAVGPYHIQLRSTNTDAPTVDLASVPASGLSRVMLFQKINKRANVILIANVVSGPTNTPGDVLHIPPPFVTVERSTVQTLAFNSPGSLICSGNGNGDPREGPDYGPPPPGANEEFVPSATQINVTGKGSWDNDQFPPNPPYFRLLENTGSSIRARSICMPNNTNSQAWVTTQVTYQKKKTDYSIVLSN